MLSNALKPGKIKCVVWDLDETLWHGRLLDGDMPKLRPAIPEILRELDNRGIIHSIASTNHHDYAWPHLDRLGIAEYFVAPQIHMGSKVDSIKKISEVLHYHFGHIAFIDDDPMERDLVQSMLPDVLVLSESDYLRLPDMPVFQPAYQTEEGVRRRQMLREELERDKAVQKYSTLEAFLHSCEITFQGRIAQEKDFNRLSELAHRTNRMNVSGARYEVGQMREWITRKGHYILLATLKDKYGDYGVVAAALMKEMENGVHVEALWISCRVGKKGLPGAFFSYLGRFAHSLGHTQLRVLYNATGANRLAAFHLGTYGFESKPHNNGGAIEYILRLPDKIKEFPAWITAKYD